jgi:hypothetical protein
VKVAEGNSFIASLPCPNCTSLRLVLGWGISLPVAGVGMAGADPLCHLGGVMIQSAETH